MTQQKVIEQKIKLGNGQIRIKKYLIGNFLGKGGFARCYQATDLQTQSQVAIKIVNKENLAKSRAKQKLLSEIKIHRALIHPYIVKFITVFQDESNVYIVLQLCSGRSMSQMIKKRKYLTCEQTRYYILQLLSSIQYLHSNKVIHRDLKMANIFLNESMEVKLGDFGLSAKLQFFDERKRTMAGTPNYIAPQIIDGTGGHSYEVDFWSTGVICYALLFGRPPFETSQLKMTYSRIKNCQYSFPSSIQVPSSAKDFIKHILVLDPKKRLTIAQMYQHPFLRGERPRSIPRYATDQMPMFNKTELIVQQNQNLPQYSDRFQNKQKPQIQTNVLSNSNQLNKLSVTKSNTLSQNKRLTGSIQKHNQKLEAVTPKSVKLKSNNAYSQKLKYLGVTVINHVDYSTKYGLGYYLSNRCMGVYFNDSTIMAFDEINKNFYYIEDPAHNDKPAAYSQAFVPNDHNLKKKKMLLHKFQGHLKQQGQKPLDKLQNCQGEEPVLVKQWLKTKHAIMFRLSNKIFQVDFFDHSQILLRTDTKQIRFKSKKGEQQYMLLSEALNDKQRDTELGRRIKYTKEILNSLKKEQTENAHTNVKLG